MTTSTVQKAYAQSKVAVYENVLGQGLPSPLQKYCKMTDYSLIAQSVERRTVNPQVPGSSPGRGAKILTATL